MILEIADFRIQPGRQAAFEAAIHAAIDATLSKADGFVSAEVHQSIETPERFVLTVQWKTLEAHNDGFRNGPLFPEWRRLVGPFFASPPVVENFRPSVRNASRA